MYNTKQYATTLDNIYIQYKQTILYDIVSNFITKIVQYCRQYWTISKTKLDGNIVMHCTIQYIIIQNATISNNIDIQYIISILYDIVSSFVTNIVQYCEQYLTK